MDACIDSSRNLLHLNLAYEERWDSAPYYFDNSIRGSKQNSVIVQRTISGSCFFHDKTANEPKYYDIHAGDVFLFSHGEDSEYGRVSGDTEPYILDFIDIGGLEALRLFNYVQQVSGRIYKMQPNSELESIWNQLFEGYRKGFGDRFYESELLFRLFMNLMRSNVVQAQDKVQLAQEIIYNHFKEPITFQEIADRVGYSREYLSREYKKKLGVNPREELQSLRLNRAKYLLTKAKIPVEEVAFESGYVDGNSFARMFRQKTGISPSDWRKRG